MLVVFSLTLHSQCLDYNGNPVENFYKAPSNLSDLSYKIKIYGDTLDCVFDEFNYKGEWNNNLIFGSKKALNILEEGISQIKFTGKNEKALKNFLLTMIGLQYSFENYEGFDASFAFFPSLKNSLELINKSIKLNENVIEFHAIRLLIYREIFGYFFDANSYEADFYKEKWVTMEDFNLTIEELEKKSLKRIEKIRDEIEAFVSKNKSKILTEIKNSESKIDNNKSLALNQIIAKNLKFRFNEYNWSASFPFERGDEYLFEYTANTSEISNYHVQLINKNYKAALDEYPETYDYISDDKKNYGSLGRAMLYFINKDFKSAIEHLKLHIKSDDMSNPMRIGEKLINDYFENEDFYYSDKVFSYGFQKQKIDTTDLAYEHFEENGVWNPEFISKWSWSFNSLYSIFLLGKSYEKIGDELNSKKYFSICKKLLLEDYFRDDFNLDTGEEIELQNILNHNIDYIKSKIQS